MSRFERMRPLRTALAAALALAFLVAAEAHATPGPKVLVGGPSDPSEAKIAIVGGPKQLKGDRFTVKSTAGKTVLRGRLTRAPGKPDPWDHAFAADLSKVTTPGRYVVSVGKLKSRPWTVAEGATSPGIQAILAYFRANRDGNEPSPIHGPSHLTPAVIHPHSPVLPGQAIDMSGGWMDAGDMIHFTQTTAYATAMLEAAARLSPADATALTAEADVGIRWLVKAHPAPGVFIAQVGDDRDHQLGFRDPVDDATSTKPGIGVQNAYPEIGGDLGGKAATALALAYMRTGNTIYLDQAEDWYAAGRAAGRPARPLKDAGYPGYASDFYAAPNWKDSMASGAAELYRATCQAGACDASYQADFLDFLDDSGQTGPYAAMGAVDDFASFGEAEACGAFGGTNVFSDQAKARGCELLGQNGRIATKQGASNAFGMPGYFSWGTTAQNGAAGALAALSGGSSGCRTAAGARDYLLGRNPYGASFVVGYGPRSPNTPHHWGSVFGKGIPAGAVVGGPAPLREIKSQGFPVRGKLGSKFATYEDRRADYVTSEPAIDYSAASILMLAAIGANC